MWRETHKDWIRIVANAFRLVFFLLSRCCCINYIQYILFISIQRNKHTLTQSHTHTHTDTFILKFNKKEEAEISFVKIASFQMYICNLIIENWFKVQLNFSSPSTLLSFTFISSCLFLSIRELCNAIHARYEFTLVATHQTHFPERII